MILKSLAKVNLFLNVYGKREQDGYHLLDSLVAFTEDIYDQIEVNITSETRFMPNGGEFASYIENSSTNLITKAISKLPAHNFYDVKLIKDIPVAAGIGGGSSNAGSILKYIIAYEKLELTRQQITEICLSIGADVPVCFHHKVSYFSGIGEIIEDVTKFPDMWAVLVNPMLELLTKDIFKVGVKCFSDKLIAKPYQFNSFEELIEFIAKQNNGLEHPAITCMPLIREIIDRISKTKNCYLARMSGSGPTCFGLFKTKQDAINAQHELLAIYPNWWIRFSKLK